MFFNAIENNGIGEKVVTAFSPTTFLNWKSVTVILLAIVLALFNVGCTSSNAASKHENGHSEKQVKVVQTTVVEATMKDVPKFIEVTGSFLADESTEVAPETSGKVAAVFANEGTFVKQGDIIVRLSEVIYYSPKLTNAAMPNCSNPAIPQSLFTTNVITKPKRCVPP
jgi:hypothetical protein